MKIALIHKVFTLLMAFLMLGSSMGFAMDMHFCGNQIKNVSFIGAATVCEHHNSSIEEQAEHACCKAKAVLKDCQHKTSIKDDCCHNKKLIVDTNESTETSKLTLTQPDRIISMLAFMVTYFNLLSSTHVGVDYTHYLPPVLVHDITIQQQVFRI